MKLETQTEDQIRNSLMTELEGCFPKVLRRYENAGEAEREFLRNLIATLRESAEDVTSSTLGADF